MTGEIGLLGAFAGGILALLSPCAALLLPAFFALTYRGIGTLTVRTGLFFLGLVAVLAPVGAGLAAAGSLLTEHRAAVNVAASVILIVLGLVMVFGGGFGFGTLSTLADRVEVVGPLSTVLLGAAYGFAGFCSGPLLGAVLTVSVVGADPLYGALVMTAYAAGMTVPLLFLAVFWDSISPRVRQVLRGREFSVGRLKIHTTSLISGLALVAIGILLWATDGTAALGSPVGASTQVRWQDEIARWASSVTNLEVLTAVVAVLVVVLAVRVWRRRSVE